MIDLIRWMLVTSYRQESYDDRKDYDMPPLATLDHLLAQLTTLVSDDHKPFVVGIDGRSGVGKSTLSAAISRELNVVGRAPQVTVIEGDEFFAGGSAEAWERRTIAENAERVIDWHRQREVLEDLLRDGVATWHPFDWDAEPWISMMHRSRTNRSRRTHHR